MFKWEKHNLKIKTIRKLIQNKEVQILKKLYKSYKKKNIYKLHKYC